MMKSHTRLGIITLGILAIIIILARLLNTTHNSVLISPNLKIDLSQTFSFDFKSKGLSEIIQRYISQQNGKLAVYIENLQTGEKYSYKELEIFPAASLYKLILLAAVLKEVEAKELSLDDTLVNTKTHLINVLGEEDFGYEDMPENITFTINEALQRVGRISDNFAAIMLTEKLRALRVGRGGGNEQSSSSNKLLIRMAQDLGMNNTNFDRDPIETTVWDIGRYFKLLYKGEVVSIGVSDKIIELLSLSNINDRVPAKLPEGIKVVHKTGELPRIRHDGGIVYLEESPYVIVLFSKDLQYEDEGVETLANISRDVYKYFSAQK